MLHLIAELDDDDDNDDPFASDVDDNENETNEVCIELTNHQIWN